MSEQTERETTYHDVHERYQRDAMFRTMVDMMVQFVVKEKYTPSEMRDAAFMASLQFDHIYRITEHRFVFRDREVGP